MHACHEGAIGLVGGKARLLRDDYCDGLGDCLPACPENAIEFIEREAAAYDEAAVIAEKMRRAQAEIHASMPAGGCPGSMAKTIVHEAGPDAVSESGQAAPAHGVNSASNASSFENPFPAPAGGVSTVVNVPARLSNWPVEKARALQCPYFQGCDLLVAAHRTAFADGAFHERLLEARRRAPKSWLPEASMASTMPRSSRGTPSLTTTCQAFAIGTHAGAGAAAASSRPVRLHWQPRASSTAPALARAVDVVGAVALEHPRSDSTVIFVLDGRIVAVG